MKRQLQRAEFSFALGAVILFGLGRPLKRDFQHFAAADFPRRLHHQLIFTHGKIRERRFVGRESQRISAGRTCSTADAIYRHFQAAATAATQAVADPVALADLPPQLARVSSVALLVLVFPVPALLLLAEAPLIAFLAQYAGLLADWLRELGFAYVEIAESLGTTEAAVKMQVKRAFEKMRSALTALMPLIGPLALLAS